MELEHEFRAPARVSDVWPLLLDVERVAPCLPGAEVLSRTGEHDYEVAMKVAVGPMRMRYEGQITITEADTDSRRAVMMASAKEARGQGTASAAITMLLAEEGNGTRVTLLTELTLTGRVAQMGRGLIEQVAGEMLAQFASCLSAEVERQSSPRGGPTPADSAKPPAAPPTTPALNPLTLLARTIIARVRRRFSKAGAR